MGRDGAGDDKPVLLPSLIGPAAQTQWGCGSDRIQSRVGVVHFSPFSFIKKWKKKEKISEVIMRVEQKRREEKRAVVVKRRKTKMALELLLHGHYHQFSIPTIHSPPPQLSSPFLKNEIGCFRRRTKAVLRWRRQKPPLLRHRVITAALPQLDLTEDNVKQVLVDARAEFGQIFDSSVGITGKAELAELDGPFVKISLKGRFWHKRSTVLDRLANYLKQRIPEILEVDIEDEKQLDDSPANF
ncbi:hypothetical protein LOK49_LG06G00921 [Camellia lanceoleosa]|uniref:Uncharacterized protein n=1 Tax=Camellia lanceoleosa TaxID=1840588 RepID=A0ACC0HD08_9ERIC|nr:hypothetical protein LOK49_LG06G00921 [Camellia lanceoleosa]